jgi:hypothetical protein
MAETSLPKMLMFTPLVCPARFAEPHARMAAWV